MRTESFQLPSFEELRAILAHEGVRAIPPEKESVHYGDFSTIRALLASYALPMALFDPGVRFEDLGDPVFSRGVAAELAGLVGCILETREDPERRTLFDAVYDYLSESDALRPADILFVFGSKSTLRIEKAVALYAEGHAPKLMISGRGPFYERDVAALSEAERLAEYAVERGVPHEALLLETESITLPDNVKRSLNLLERTSVPHETILLVNSPFSQRRGWTHFSKMSASGTRLIRVNADVSEQFSRDGWYKNEVGAKTIVKEFFGLRVSELLNTS